jgi:hypothetical protein
VGDCANALEALALSATAKTRRIISNSPALTKFILVRSIMRRKFVEGHHAKSLGDPPNGPHGRYRQDRDALAIMT